MVIDEAIDSLCERELRFSCDQLLHMHFILKYLDSALLHGNATPQIGDPAPQATDYPLVRLTGHVVAVLTDDDMILSTIYRDR